MSIISFHRNLVILGLGLGLCFPLIGIALDLYFKNLAISGEAIATVHKVNPILWIIDSAPLVLGTVFYFLGRNIVEREQRLQKLNYDIQHKCQNISGFVEALNQGDYETEYTSEDDDAIVVTLNSFRENLKQKSDTDRIRIWTNEGLAKFGELLRADAEDIASICQTILSNLINYVQLNQGAVFVLNDAEDEPCLKLSACYAWNKPQYVDRKIRLNETLVGQCWAEEKTIYLSKVPEGYFTITSGLGESLPNVAIVLPLKTKERVIGVLELASFQPLEPHQVEFLEKIAESWAAVLQTLTTNAQIRTLLEQTQKQTKAMQAQEEEMRQNMEEMQATHEEFVRKEQRYLATIQKLENK